MRFPIFYSHRISFENVSKFGLQEKIKLIKSSKEKLIKSLFFYFISVLH